MKEDKDVFFVGIENGIELRRNILESLKYSIENLQSYEKLKAIREEKTKNLAKLRKTLRDVSALVNDIKDELPKTGLRAKPKVKEIREIKEEVKEVKIVEKPHKASELDKLSEELRDIESKLNGLA